MATATKDRQNKSALDRKFFNMGTTKGVTEYEKHRLTNNGNADIDDFSNFDNYINKGEQPALTVGDAMLFEDSGNTLVVNEGVVYYPGGNFPFIHEPGFDENFTPAQSAARYRNGLTELGNGDVIGAVVGVSAFYPKTTLIRNGDENQNYLVENFVGDHITVSFDVLSEMFGLQNIEIGKRLAAGTLVVIDHTDDESKVFTATEDKLHKEAKGNAKLEPTPPVGFSLVRGGWHRSASCLIRDIQKKQTVLVGQDEGSYFACLLPTNPTKIKDAYADLMPEGTKGKKFQRQGEWFVTYITDKQIPKDAVIMYYDDDKSIGLRIDSGVILPKETRDSNNHTIDGFRELRVGPNGQVYALGGTLEHDQHDTVEWKKDQWVTFLKNTALKSVSTQGVD